jgi:hypothetical protein
MTMQISLSYDGSVELTSQKTGAPNELTAWFLLLLAALGGYWYLLLIVLLYPRFCLLSVFHTISGINII